MRAILYYIHDPMCSWCWAFRPTWQKIRAALPEKILIQYVLGGLAPDTHQPMPLEQQHKIQRIWETIKKQVPGTEFNFDFWAKCQPRRSTYPACRAVIAAARQEGKLGEAMILLIQRAYYLQARNPSDDSTLIELAIELGLDEQRFTNDLNSSETQAELFRQIQFAQIIGAQGFPSLVLQQADEYSPIRFSYRDPSVALSQIRALWPFS
ncbi:DsbA family protein [Nitrosococcus wardiae]|uniref:DsbA family protein n=1 Tax=Nitrosococcus wardiae TaxID=1814290 RepID=A0A4P7BY04_9GAMM|nr:DsbA family protein [Nitrosococcus wardiae]QBQ55068.1 DsbA family protein [Nitrosococcus wardiae]